MWQVEHFNFVRYEPEISVESKEVPGYSYLEGLWSQFLGLTKVQKAGVGATPEEFGILGAQSPYLQALESWRATVISADNELRRRVSEVTPRSFSAT